MLQQTIFYHVCLEVMLLLLLLPTEQQRPQHSAAIAQASAHPPVHPINPFSRH
jgi:hypothetical protein